MTQLEGFHEISTGHDAVDGTQVVPEKSGMAVAYAALILFELVYFMRPEDWISGIGSIPLAKITGLLVTAAFFLGLLTSRSRPVPKFTKLMVIFFLQLCVSVVFSIFRSGSLQIVNNFLNVVIITTVIVYVAVTEKRLKRLMLVQALSIFAISVLSVWRFRQGFALRGRMVGVLGGVFENANDLALNMAIVLPFALAFLVQAKTAMKLFWMIVAGALVYAIILTSSRGGFLAFIAGMMVWLWHIGFKEGKKIWLVLALFGAIAVVIAAPPHYAERLMSITDADKDTTGSSQERARLLERSVQISAQNPLFGVGPGNFQVVSGNWLVSHNAYAQLASEAGLPAFFLFCYIIWDAFKCLKNSLKLPRPPHDSRALIVALKASLAALMTGAIFTNISYHYYPYFVFGYCTALFAIEKQKYGEIALTTEDQEQAGVPE